MNGVSDPRCGSYTGDFEIPNNDYTPSTVDSRVTAAPVDGPLPDAGPSPVAESERETAYRIEHGAAAVYTQAVVHAGVGAIGDVNVMARYMESITGQCTTGNPLEKMLIETIVLLYHRAASLHVSSTEARTPEAVVAYSAAALKVQAELRKSMQTLRELQQVPMEAGVYIQRIVRVERASPVSDSQDQHTKLGSNSDRARAGENSHGGTNNNGAIATQSTASDCWEDQYKAAETDLRGPRKAASRNSTSSAMASRNGAKNRGR